ncbi:MAG: hypothetical protein ACRCX2_01235 [Paraclostridium sp.]
MNIKSEYENEEYTIGALDLIKDQVNTSFFEDFKRYTSVNKINIQSEFNNFLKKSTGGNLITQPKLDGVNLMIQYKNGEIIHAATRSGNIFNRRIKKIEVIGVDNNFSGTAFCELLHVGGFRSLVSFVNKFYVSEEEINEDDMKIICFHSRNDSMKWKVNYDISEDLECESISDIKIHEKYMNFQCDGTIIKRIDRPFIACAYKGKRILFKSKCIGITYTMTDKRVTPICEIEPVMLPTNTVVNKLTLFSPKMMSDMGIEVGSEVYFKTESNYNFPVVVGSNNNNIKNKICLIEKLNKLNIKNLELLEN